MRQDEPFREPNPVSGLTIRLFGGMTIEDSGGTDYRPRSRKTRAIVAILTLTAPKSWLRSHLTALLWSRRGTEQGRASLRQAVHELQGSLGSTWNRILTAERHSLAFNLENVTVDALEAAGAGASKTVFLRLFEDGFLEELDGLDPAFDAWLSKERRRLVALARIGGEAFLEESHPREEIILTARSLLRLDPGNGVAWRALIEAHIQASDRAAARFACEQWAEAMGLGADATPPPEMVAYLSRIRFGSERHGPDFRRHGVMEDVQRPAGPIAEGFVPNGVTDSASDWGGSSSQSRSRHDAGAGDIAKEAHPDEISPDRVAETAIMPDRVAETVIVPERAMQDRAMPFRLTPGGATRDRFSPDREPANRVAEAIVLPDGNGTARDRAMPNVVAPNWGMPRRMMPDGISPNAGLATGVMENRIVPGRPTPGEQVTGVVAPRRTGGPIEATETRTAAANSLTGGPERRPSRSTLRLGIREMRVIGPNVDDALSVGLAEEVTTALSRFRWISCVSGSSLAAIAGDTADANVRWSELDLDLLLDGTIQYGGDRVRITVRLLDMHAGEAVIWANRFDHDASDTLTVQDRVASAIVAQVDPLLLMREGERAATRNQRGVTASDLVLQAVPAIYRMDRLSFHAAGELLEAALRAEPTHTDALAWFAYWHLFLVGQGWTDEPDAATRRAGELADTAVAMAPNDARALTLASHVRAFLLKRPAEAAVLHDRAISLNPNLAIAWCFSGFALSYLGDHQTSLVRMEKAIELSPSDPHLFFFQAAIIMPHLLLGQYQEAAAAGRKAIELNPWFSSAFKGCLSALGHLGPGKEAASVLARLLKLEPNFAVQDAVRRSPMTVAADIERYADGLRRAGLPEG
jgi:DNA-binding SARP family transcriptional activator/TolB-like protein